MTGHVMFKALTQAAGRLDAGSAQRPGLLAVTGCFGKVNGVAANLEDVRGCRGVAAKA